MRLKDLSDDLAEGQKREPERRDESASRPVVEIWIDGGCRGNPGKGAWAAVIYDGPKPKGVWGAEPEAPPKRMQLWAAIEALKVLEEPRQVRVHSCSVDLIHAFQKGWLHEWEHNGWRTPSNRPIVHQDLWHELLALTRRHQATWWVAGQDGVPANTRCHDLLLLALNQTG
jgi:ribonuclease HI